MNVCILAPFNVIDPVSGSPRRVFEISAGLANAGVPVIILHSGPSGTVQRNLRAIGFAGLERLPLMRNWSWSGAADKYLSPANLSLHRSLIRLCKELGIDILQIEGPWSIFSARMAHAINRKMPIVYDAHNVESISVRFSSSAHWLWPYATFIERQAAKRSALVFCVSDLDKNRMCSINHLPSSKVVVVPNGVRSSLYRADFRGLVRKRLGLESDRKIVFFHGALSWKPNADAAQTILKFMAPRLEVANPEIVFLIAGPHPSRTLIEQARSRRNVRVLGPVPNIDEYIGAADVCIAPMTMGSGTKLKILEYMAAGKVVVATRKAVEGMGIQNGIEALITANADEQFTQAVMAAVTDEVYQGLGQTGRAYAKHFEWSAIAEKVVQVYESILN